MESKLKDILRQYNISQKAFKEHVANHKPRSEEWAKSVLQNKTRLNFQTIKIVVETLRELTEEDIFVQDVLNFPYDKYQHLLTQTENTSAAKTVAEENMALVLVPENYRENDVEEDRLWLELSNSIANNYALSTKNNAENSTGNNEKRHKENPNPLSPQRPWLWQLAFILVALAGGFWFGINTTFPKKPSPLGGSANVQVPRLIGPEGKITDLSPKLRVETVRAANDYEFSVFNLKSRKNIFISNTPNPFYNLPKNVLCPDAPYGWKARAAINGRWSSFASTMEFFVSDNTHPWRIYAQQENEPETPNILEPNGIVTSLPVILKVSEVEGAIGYGFYLRDLETEHLYDFEYDSQNHELRLPEGVIQDGHRYGWNARARNCAGFSDYTQRLEFEVNLSNANYSANPSLNSSTVGNFP